MRDAFAHELLAAAERDARVVLLSGDIGNRMFDRFKERFPERFFNCGVAEASMMSVAAGMAMSGLRPVVYTIVPFVTTRCLEQIRVDVCYHRQPVTVVGVGGGLSYASLGSTHHACEDIGFLRLLPNMTVVCPADPVEVRCALRAVLAADAPAYLRLGKKGEPLVHAAEPEFRIGRSITIRPGSRVALLAIGHMLPLALAAADRLAAHGVYARVESFHTIKPLDEACLRELFTTFETVVTIEEHSILGGAGSAVAEWLASQTGTRARLRTIGTADRFLYTSGSTAHARRTVGLDPDAIVTAILGRDDRR